MPKPNPENDDQKPHGEKEQMTEPQEEFIGQENVPSKDISEVAPKERKVPEKPS